MTDAADFLAIDFDQHYYEQPDCFTRHVAPGFREAAIRVVPDRKEDAGSAGRRWSYKGSVLDYMPGVSSDVTMKPGTTFAFFASGSPQFSKLDEIPSDARIDTPPEMLYREPRLKVMAGHGVEACLLLPTNACAFEHAPRFLDDDVAAVCANFESFNKWLEEEWGFGTDGRLLSAPYISLIDRDWATAELERVARAGAKFVVMVPGPVYGRSPADPYFDRFWSAVEQAGIVAVYHIGFTSIMNTYCTLWSETTPDLLAMSAFQHYAGYCERTIADTIAALTLHNLFGRFPKLQVMTIELGSTWVRPLLEQMDRCARKSTNGHWLGGPIQDLPSDIFKQHVTVAPFPEEDTRALVDLIGVDRVIFGSDWPHAEGTAVPWDYAAYLNDCDAAEQRKIMRDNALRILGSPTPA